MFSPLLVKYLLLMRAIGFKLSPPGFPNFSRSLLRRFFRFSKSVVKVDDFAGRYQLELRLSEHMQRRIFWMGFYNDEIAILLARILKPGMTVFDIGANIGEVTFIAVKHVGAGGQVFSFEPVDKIADQLTRHVELNNIKNVFVERYALGESISNDVPIYSSSGQIAEESNEGLGSIFAGDSREVPLQSIRMTTMDFWLGMHPEVHVDLIKIDIEGAELACLRGAVNTLMRMRPLIIVEVQDFSSSRAGYKASEILELLAGLNYEFQRIGRNGNLTPIRASELQDFQNVLCMPI